MAADWLNKLGGHKVSLKGFSRAKKIIRETARSWLEEQRILHFFAPPQRCAGIFNEKSAGARN